jgi:hypothetical protein
MGVKFLIQKTSEGVVVARQGVGGGFGIFYLSQKRACFLVVTGQCKMIVIDKSFDKL